MLSHHIRLRAPDIEPHSHNPDPTATTQTPTMSKIDRQPDAVGARAGKAPRRQRGARAGKVHEPVVGSVAAGGTTMADWQKMVGAVQLLVDAYRGTILSSGTVVDLPPKKDGPEHDLPRLVKLFIDIVADSDTIKGMGDDKGINMDHAVALANEYVRGDDEAVSRRKPDPLLKAVVRYVIYTSLIGENAQNYFDTLMDDDDLDEDKAADYETIRSELERADEDSLSGFDIGWMSCAEFGRYLEEITEPSLGPPEKPPTPEKPAAPEKLAAPDYIS